MADPSPKPTGETEYSARLVSWRAEVSRWEKRSTAVSVVRLGVFLGGVALLWLAFWVRALSGWWLAAPVVAYVALMFVHDSVLKRKRRAETAERYFQSGLDRLHDRWIGTGPDGAQFLDPSHPYAVDLDLFGRGSLYQLLCRARTSAGRGILAQWLLRPASVEEARARQAAVRELAPAVDFRQDLAILGEEGPSKLESGGLAEWSQAPVRMRSGRIRLTAWGLAALGVVATVSWAVGLTRATPLLCVLLVQGIFRLLLLRELRAVNRLAGAVMRDLPLMADLLRRLEGVEFRSPVLHSLHQRLRTEGLPPSRRLRRLTLLQDCFEAHRNALFYPVAYVLLWEVHFAMALESWRARHGAAAAAWFEIIGEFEALASLATLAYERPEDVDPEFCEGGSDSAMEAESRPGGPLFAGTGLGHPLLPRGECVRNDLLLDGARRLLIISGSNMSGKSTWLRTVGTLYVLAFAGAPVRARSLRLSPLALGASIRVQDSLQSGVSHFAAEVQRMKQIVDLADGERPVLYLIDEVLQGTNSHDRRVGTEAVLRKLISRGALGIITTHDLALTEMAEALGPAASNVHFQDHLVDGLMVFDYRIHEGVIERSNALDLMRAAGLDV